MRGNGMLNWWKHGILGLLLCWCVRFADDAGGGGDPGGGDPGGGDPGGGGESGGWIPESITDADVRGTLGGYETAEDAFAGLHQLKASTSRPLVDSILELDPELGGAREKLSEFDSPAKLAKSYIELQKKMGANPLVAPGENASDEDKAAFQARLYDLGGRPESPDKYSYEPPKEVIDSGLDMDLFKGRMNQLHEAGLNDSQLNTVMKIFEEESGWVGDQLTEVLHQQQKDLSAFAAEQWGDDAQGNIELSGRAIEKFGLTDTLAGSALINDPKVRAAFYELAQSMGEGSLPPGGGGRGGSFDDQLAALQSAPGYDNPRHPDYDALQQKKAALYKQTYG